MKQISLALLVLTLCAGASAESSCKFNKIGEEDIHWSSQRLQPALLGSINGRPSLMLVDTGATKTMLTQKAVREHRMEIGGSNGYVAGAGGLSVRRLAGVGEFSAAGVQWTEFFMSVVESQSANPDVSAMVGIDLLMKGELELDLKNRKLRLFKSEGCEHSYLGYWDKDALEVPLFWPGSFDRRAYVTVELNGKAMETLIDSGASVSMVSPKAARRAGVEIAKGDPGDVVNVVGPTALRGWQAKFDFKLGGESIRGANLLVLNDEVDTGTDMVLGQDWLQAHRVLLAPSQKRMVFSYQGGTVFPSDGAQPWYAAEAERGDATAQYAMAMHFAARKDERAWLQWLERAAMSGDARASFGMVSRRLEQDDEAGALKLLLDYAEKSPSDGELALVVAIAQARVEGKVAARQRLTEHAVAKRESWPRPVADYMLGHAGAEDVLRGLGADHGMQCDARKFMTEWDAAQTAKPSRPRMLSALFSPCEEPKKKE